MSFDESLDNRDYACKKQISMPGKRRAFENYDVDCEDFRKERNAEITYTNYITERKNLIKRGISRLATRRNPQQPIGCEDFRKERNAEITFLASFY